MQRRTILILHSIRKLFSAFRFYLRTFFNHSLQQRSSAFICIDSSCSIRIIIDEINWTYHCGYKVAIDLTALTEETAPMKWNIVVRGKGTVKPSAKRSNILVRLTSGDKVRIEWAVEQDFFLDFVLYLLIGFGMYTPTNSYDSEQLIPRLWHPQNELRKKYCSLLNSSYFWSIAPNCLNKKLSVSDKNFKALCWDNKNKYRHVFT